MQCNNVCGWEALWCAVVYAVFCRMCVWYMAYDINTKGVPVRARHFVQRMGTAGCGLVFMHYCKAWRHMAVAVALQHVCMGYSVRHQYGRTAHFELPRTALPFFTSSSKTSLLSSLHEMVWQMCK